MTCRGTQFGIRAAFLPALLSVILLAVPAHVTQAAGGRGGGGFGGGRGYSGGGSWGGHSGGSSWGGRSGGSSWGGRSGGGSWGGRSGGGGYWGGRSGGSGYWGGRSYPGTRFYGYGRQRFFGGRRFFYPHSSRVFFDFDFGYPYPVYYYPYPAYGYGPAYPVPVEIGNYPPDGYYYYDPYCEETFSSLDGYLRHLRSADHPQVIDLMDRSTDRPAGSFEYVDGSWSPVQ